MKKFNRIDLIANHGNDPSFGQYMIVSNFGLPTNVKIFSKKNKSNSLKSAETFCPVTQLFEHSHDNPISNRCRAMQKRYDEFVRAQHHAE